MAFLRELKGNCVSFWEGFVLGVFCDFRAFFGFWRKTVFTGECAWNDGTWGIFVKVEKLAKNGEKGQNSQPLIPGVPKRWGLLSFGPLTPFSPSSKTGYWKRISYKWNGEGKAYWGWEEIKGCKIVSLYFSLLGNNRLTVQFAATHLVLSETHFPGFYHCHCGMQHVMILWFSWWSIWQLLRSTLVSNTLKYHWLCKDTSSRSRHAASNTATLEVNQVKLSSRQRDSTRHIYLFTTPYIYPVFYSTFTAFLLPFCP